MKVQRRGTREEFLALPEDTQSRVKTWVAKIEPECWVVYSTEKTLGFTEEEVRE